jgi:eight-cysteine-cluster-containing protein
MLLLLGVLACDKPREPTPESPHPRGRAGDQDEPVRGDDPPPSDEGGAEPTPPRGDRVPAIGEDHPLFARVEGEGFANDCKADADCKVGGCSGEVCSADASAVTTCDVLPMRFPDDAACGCVENTCRWWSASGATIEGGPVATDPPPMKSGEPPRPRVVECGGRTCKPGQECVEYFGIAGPSGPLLRSCEWRCGGGCPEGTRCVTIADGPGRVCR